MTPQFKLTYFGGAGRAELTRLLFHYGGVAFEDHRIEFSDLNAIRSTLPLGMLPTLEVDGVMYSQSMAIGRYVARTIGLFPEGPLQALHVDMITETLCELGEPVMVIVYRTWDDDLKTERTETYLKETMPKGFAVLESKVQGKFFLGDEASYADVYLLAVVLSIQKDLPAADLSRYPKLLAVVDQIKANSGVAAYLAFLGH